jgi:hypothetical protein
MQKKSIQPFIHITLMPETFAFNHFELFAMQVDRVGQVHHVHHPPAGVMKLPLLP